MRLIDVVYILGNESKNQDREILYSVRSVVDHLKDTRKLFIVGRLPEFFNPQEVIHIPYEDIFHNKARNIMAKIHRAASDRRVSNDFILMNDDYFLLQDASALTYPYYYKCTLQESIKINSHNADYLPHLIETEKLLKEHGLPLKNFDTHFPILYNKWKFRKICFKHNWNTQAGYIMKSLYCNSLSIEGTQIKDCKINHSHIYWEQLTKDLPVLSVGDKSCNKSLWKFLNSLFPNKSRYES